MPKYETTYLTPVNNAVVAVAIFTHPLAPKRYSLRGGDNRRKMKMPFAHICLLSSYVT